MGCGASKGKKYEASAEQGNGDVPSAKPGAETIPKIEATEIDDKIVTIPKVDDQIVTLGGPLTIGELRSPRSPKSGDLRVSRISVRAQPDRPSHSQAVSKTLSRKSVHGNRRSMRIGELPVGPAVEVLKEEDAQPEAPSAEEAAAEAPPAAAEAPPAEGEVAQGEAQQQQQEAPVAEAAAQPEESNQRWDQSIDALRDFLEEGGVNTEAFGQGTAKSLKQLMHEIEEGSTYLEIQPDGNLRRIVEPVFVQLVYNGCVLVQTEQQFADGRKRSRNMLLAEKKEPGDCGGLCTTALRGIHEELCIPLSDLTSEVVRYRGDMYSFELEQLESPSYPGLVSMYRTHYVRLDILESGLETFKHCGLPGCETFQTVETHAGSEQTHTWTWKTFDVCYKEAVKKFPPSMASVAVKDQSPEDPDPSSKDFTEEMLKNLLDADGVDTSKFGVGKAKAIKGLLKELQEGSSKLGRNAQSGRWTRIVEPAFVSVIYNGKVLVEVAQILEDGRERKRKMLLAEKKDPTDKDACDTSIRGIFEELGAPLEKLVLGEVVNYREDVYCCQTEHLDSASYPGIPCCYYTHYCQVDVLEGGLEVFKDFGLPDCVDFETEEHTKAGTKKMQWSWWDLEYARTEKVKGMLKPPEPVKDVPEVKVEYPVPVDIPPDEAALAKVLQDGGVPVTEDWADQAGRILTALLTELRDGIGFLERCPTTGRIMRVAKPAFIQLKWNGAMLVPDEQVSRPSDAGASADGAPPAEDAGSAEAGGKQTKELLEAELGTIKQLEQQGARNAIDFRPDLNCFELKYFDSASYPGLHCVQRTKFVQFEQRPQDDSR